MRFPRVTLQKYDDLEIPIEPDELEPRSVVTTFLSVFTILTLLTLADFAGPRAKAPALGAAFVILLLLAACRYMVPDYGNYQVDFNATPPLGDSNLLQQYELIHGEYGYLLLNSIVKTLGGSFPIVAAVVAFVAICANFFVIARLSPFPLLSILVYYSHLFFNKELILARAGVASAIVLVGLYVYAERRSIMLFLCFVVAAALFHAAAFVSIAMIFVFKTQLRQSHLFAIIITAFAFSLVGRYPTDLLFAALEHTNLMPNSLRNYIGYDSYDYRLSPFNPKAIQQLIVIAALYHWRAVLSARIPAFDVLFAAYMVSTLVLISLSDFAILAARLATMLSNVEFILVPGLLLALAPRERMLGFLAVVGISLVVLLGNLNSDRMPNYENYIADEIVKLVR